MERSLKSQDFLLDFYKDNPDSLYLIGEWETELQCVECSGPIDKDAHCLYNQQFPTTNADRRNLALKDARCPHCHATGKIEKISESHSLYTPLPTKEVWFRVLTIDPPTKRVKKWLGYQEIPQQQRYIKEYRNPGP